MYGTKRHKCLVGMGFNCQYVYMIGNYFWDFEFMYNKLIILSPFLFPLKTRGKRKQKNSKTSFQKDFCSP